MTIFNSKVSISYYVDGALNSLGEPARTLTSRATGVPARLQNKSPKLMFDFPIWIDSTGKSGEATVKLMILWVGLNQTIEERDIVTDTDGNTYKVAETAVLHTHISALLQREV